MNPEPGVPGSVQGTGWREIQGKCPHRGRRRASAEGWYGPGGRLRRYTVGRPVETHLRNLPRCATLYRVGFRNLGEFLAELEREGELARIRCEVNPYLEAAFLAVTATRSGGPALLFERPGGSPFPLAMNLFGTERRMARALGVGKLEELSARMEEILKVAGSEPPRRLRFLGQLFHLSRLRPRRISRAPVQEVVKEGEQVDLGELPVVTTWPRDAGPFVTLPLVITRDPETGRRNVGMYRLQVLGSRRLALHWQEHKTGHRHFQKARARGEKLPVAVALGGDPATIYSASAPLPEGWDELLLAGLLRGEGVELAPAKTVPLEVPAEAEFVIEGWADPAAPPALEGPFGDHTGYYTPPAPFPVLEVTAITHREKPIYPATVVGRPPMEDYWLGQATERLFLPLVRLLLPEVEDYHMPPEGTFHNLVFVSIKKEYPGQAYRVAYGLWGMGLMSLAKVIVVVDAGVNVHDPQEAWWYALSNCDPERDVLIARGPLDVLDHASRLPSFGGKMVVDGTEKLPGEGVSRPFPQLVEPDPATLDLVRKKWPLYELKGVNPP